MQHTATHCNPLQHTATQAPPSAAAVGSKSDTKSDSKRSAVVRAEASDASASAGQVDIVCALQCVLQVQCVLQLQYARQCEAVYTQSTGAVCVAVAVCEAVYTQSTGSLHASASAVALCVALQVCVAVAMCVAVQVCVAVVVCVAVQVCVGVVVCVAVQVCVGVVVCVGVLMWPLTRVRLDILLNIYGVLCE